ncbi:hypothetical protein BBG19_1544 [Francisella sp. MA067296]|nr:hypothetical protein BBG19_1544 [Francisella sp. MA067296]
MQMQRSKTVGAKLAWLNNYPTQTMLTTFFGLNIVLIK